MEHQSGDQNAGELRRETAEANAELIIGLELERFTGRKLTWPQDARAPLTKLAMAARVRRERTLTIKAIAGRLNVSLHTVRGHVEHALKKLGLHSKAEAVAFAFRNHLF